MAKSSVRRDKGNVCDAASCVRVGCLALCDGGREVIRLLAKARIRLTSDRRHDVE